MRSKSNIDTAESLVLLALSSLKRTKRTRLKAYRILKRVSVLLSEGLAQEDFLALLKKHYNPDARAAMAVRYPLWHKIRAGGLK